MKREKFHDVMNSASVIKNMIDLLLEEEVEPSKREMLIKIQNRAEKISETVSTW